MSYHPHPVKQLFHNGRRTVARFWRSLLPATVIAITGSQGKTNTSSTLYGLLSSLAPTVRTDLNLDTVYNVPITALKIMPWTKFAVFELGIDHPGEMDMHLEIVHPTIAVVTGISPVHTDAEHLGSLENLIHEKQKLVEALPAGGYAVLNGDDEHVRSMADQTKAHVIFYGKNGGNDIRATNITSTLDGVAFDIEHQRDPGFPGDKTLLHVSAPLIGLHHVYTIMVSYIIYRILGYSDLGKFQYIASKFRTLPGRMSLEEGPLGTTVLNDSLRANPVSTASGLETFSQIKTAGKKIAVLAEMGELEKPDEEHGKIGRLISTLNIDYVVAIGALHSATQTEARKGGYPVDRFIMTSDVLEAAEVLKKIISRGDIIYLKGSLLRHIERVLMSLQGEKVGCRVISCPLYNNCPECRYKLSGYPFKS